MSDGEQSRSNRLGRFLKAQRKRVGLRAQEVANRSQSFPKPMRISQSYLSDIESKGRVPSALKLIGLARLYEITILEVFKILGASEIELGYDGAAVFSELVLYPDNKHRDIHKEMQRLLEAGFEGQVTEFLENAGEVLKALEPGMEALSRACKADCSAVILNGRRILFERGTEEADRHEILKNTERAPEGWTRFDEGSARDFQLTLLLKCPRLTEDLRRSAEVALIRWWAGLRSAFQS